MEQRREGGGEEHETATVAAARPPSSKKVKAEKVRGRGNQKKRKKGTKTLEPPSPPPSPSPLEAFSGTGEGGVSKAPTVHAMNSVNTIHSTVNSCKGDGVGREFEEDDEAWMYEGSGGREGGRGGEEGGRGERGGADREVTGGKRRRGERIIMIFMSIVLCDIQVPGTARVRGFKSRLLY